MADQKYTPIGHEIWRWWRTELWKPLAADSDAKMVWLVFYTSREAKVSVPGLWPGCVYVIANHCGLSANAAHNALDRLIAHGLAQFDADNQLVRFALPDGLDRAHTAQAIWGWWGRFKSLPNCPLRNAHVPVLWDLIQSGKTNQKMVDAWKETFGTVVIPAHLPTFLPPSSSDTSTQVQRGLFAAPLELSPPPSNEINNSGPSPHATDLRSGSGSGFLRGADPDHPTPTLGRPLLQLVPAVGEISTPASGNRLAQDAQDASDRARAEHVAGQARALREALSEAGLKIFSDQPTLEATLQPTLEETECSLPLPA